MGYIIFRYGYMAKIINHSYESMKLPLIWSCQVKRAYEKLTPQMIEHLESSGITGF